MIFFVSVSIPLGFCNPIIPILDIGYTPFDHFYIWAIDHLLNGMHTTTTTCSVSRCHPPHRPNHLAWQWTIWTMDGFEKKKLQETMGFLMVLFFYCQAWQHKDPLCSCWMEKTMFFIGILRGFLIFLPRLPRLPFWGVRNSERHSASGFLWNYGSI